MYLKSKKKQVNVRRLPAGLTASMDKNALTDLLVGQPTAELSNEKSKIATAHQDRSKSVFDKIFRRRQKQQEPLQEKRYEYCIQIPISTVFDICTY